MNILYSISAHSALISGKIKLYKTTDVSVLTVLS